MRSIMVALTGSLLILTTSTAQSLDFFKADTFSKSDDSKVAITYSGVDDIISVFVLNRSTASKIKSGGGWWPVKMDQWSANPGASGNWDISSDLRSGGNIVMVAVENLVYTGFCLGKCGKVSWSYKFTCGDKTVNTSARSNRVNHVHLAHLFAVKIIKESDKLTVTKLSKEEEDTVGDVEGYIDSFLGQQGTTDVDWGQVLETLK